MNLRFARLPFVLLILSATSFLGLGKSPTLEIEVTSKLATERQLSGTPLSAAERERRAQDYAAYLQRRFRAAYERAGIKNPRWNEKFLALLDMVAKDRAGIRGIKLKEILERVQELSDLRCTDPHFRYHRACPPGERGLKGLDGNAVFGNGWRVNLERRPQIEPL